MHADGPSLTESIRKTPLGVRHAFGVRRADLATLRDRLLYERTPAFVQEIEHEEIAGILQRRTCYALATALSRIPPAKALFRLDWNFSGFSGSSALSEGRLRR